MIGRKWLFGVFPFVVGLSLVGCENPAPGETGADEEEDSVEQPIGVAGEEGQAPKQRDDAQDRHEKRGKFGKHGDRGPGARAHHGPKEGMLLHAALKHLELDDARREIIQGELDAVREARPEMADTSVQRKALADAIRAGVMGEAELEPLVKAAHPAPPANPPERLVTAIQKLHDILSEAERKQLVDAMVAKMDKHDFKGPPPDAIDADVDDDAAAPPARAGKDGKRFGKGFGKDFKGRGGPHGGPMKMFMAGLDLTEAQREAIRNVMKDMRPSDADFEAMREEHVAKKQERTAALQTFVANDFSARDFVNNMPHPGKHFEGKDAHMAKMLSSMLPILTADQRAKVADRVERGFQHDGMRKGSATK